MIITVPIAVTIMMGWPCAIGLLGQRMAISCVGMDISVQMNAIERRSLCILN